MISVTPLFSSAPPSIWGANETGQVAVMEGRSARLLCEARGTPTPDIAWFKDGALLAPSADVIYSRGGRQLQLRSVQAAHAGVYTCQASNVRGITEKATRLQVYGEWSHSRSGEGVGQGKPIAAMGPCVSAAPTP